MSENSEPHRSEESSQSIEPSAGERPGGELAAGDTEPRVLVLLCTYNELGNLPKMFALLGQFLPAAEVLVVDDNSPDGTGDFVRTTALENPKVHLVGRSGKLGLGTATRDGLRWGLERQFDFIINLDADLSHDPSNAPELLAACVGGQRADVAVGSRYVPGGGFDGLAWHRRLISRVLNGYATRLLGLPIRDCSGSYRCYRATALSQLDMSQLTCTGYGFLEEILVALHRGGAKLVEVPIRFETRHHGESKLGMSDALGAIRVIHRMIFRK